MQWEDEIMIKNVLNRQLNIVLKLVHSRRRSKDLAIFKCLLNGNKFSMIDIGASGGSQSRWSRFSPQVDSWSVEPDVRSRDELIGDKSNEDNGINKIIYDALSDHDGYIDLYLTRDPQKTSVFRPNYEIIGKFPDSKNYDVVDMINIKCSSLDSIIQKNSLAFDFLKIDTQGSELSILQGGAIALKGILGIEVEIEFAEIYENQPLFTDVYLYLVEQGFEILDFVYLSRWGNYKFSGLGKLMFGDAVFLRNPESMVESATNATEGFTLIRRYIALLFVYRQYDLILHVLDLCMQSSLVLESDALPIKKMIMEKQKSVHALQKIINILNRFINEKSSNEPTSPHLSLNI